MAAKDAEHAYYAKTNVKLNQKNSFQYLRYKILPFLLTIKTRFYSNTFKDQNQVYTSLCAPQHVFHAITINIIFQALEQYVFCPNCNALYKGWDVSEVQLQHPKHNAETGIPFTGVYVQTNFLTTAEEEALMKGVDEMPWQGSQSGRRKQVRILNLFICTQQVLIFKLNLRILVQKPISKK